MYRLIPKLVYCINKKIKFPLHGNGSSKRDFIFEDDFNSGILKIINRGKVGSKYHFSGSKFFKISEVIKKVLLVKNYSWKKLIFKTKDRIGKDKNYFLSCEKTKKSLLWKQNISLDEGLKKTIKFYDNIIDEVNDNDARYIL